MDIIQQCEVTGLNIRVGRVTGVETTHDKISGDKISIAVAGHTGILTKMTGFQVPVTSMALQAMVSEPIKPCLNTQMLSPVIHAYVGQSDRGELVIGGGVDVYNSYAQRGGIPMLEEIISSVLELFPSFYALSLNFLCNRSMLNGKNTASHRPNIQMKYSRRIQTGMVN